MGRLKLGIVIPAFNEEKTISNIVENTISHGVVIVVDDGSKDETAKIASDKGAVVVKHEHNEGYDNALNSGFKKAASLGVEMILTFDADGQHSFSLINDFILEIDKGYDVVVGIRSKQARLGELIFSWVSNKLWNIRDPQCGMKAYKTEVYNKLGHFDSYSSVGTELCIFAAKNKFQISQISFESKERVDQPRLGNALQANYKIIRAMILGILKNHSSLKNDI